VYTITTDIQGNPVPTSEKKEYFCNRCGSEWTQMDVLDRFDASMGFLCHRCDYPLVHDLERNSTGHEQSTRLNNQFKFVTELLQKIDHVHVPDNNFELALGKARPVIRDAAHQSIQSVPVDSAGGRPTAVKGLTNTGPKSMAVSISTSDGLTEAELAAEKARKDKIALQNALPEWMSNSTVTGQSFSSGARNLPSKGPEDSDTKDVSLPISFTEREHTDIDNYFAQLKAEQAEAARKELEEEEYGSEEEEEDEGDFEDVLDATSHAAGDAMATASLGDSRHISTTGSLQEDSERHIKRVKVEPPKEAAEEENESEEDMEFEDV
jgi:transcription initiation factor TFIIE subunit alpha